MIAACLPGTGISASQVGRILAGLELAPHQVRGWMNRRDDEQFWAHAAAVCEVYLRPPPDTVVICIDEKTGIQAKYRRYPERPPAPGRPAGVGVRPQRHRLPHRRAGGGHRAGRRRAHRPLRLGYFHRLPAPPGPVHRPPAEHSPRHGQRIQSHLPRHPGLDRRASPDHGHLHAEARLVAGHGRTMVLRPDSPASAQRRVHFPRRPRPARSPTSRSVTTAPPVPYTWTYDAAADYARHLARHTRSGQSLAFATATSGALPKAASPSTRLAA
jgi:hypothetical protein